MTASPRPVKKRGSALLSHRRYDWKTKTPDTTGIVPGLFSASPMGATNLNLRGGFGRLIRQKRNRSALSRKGGFLHFPLPAARGEVHALFLRDRFDKFRPTLRGFNPRVAAELGFTRVRRYKFSKSDKSDFDGEVAERLKAPHSKCGVRVTVSWVRIPPSPPTTFPTICFSSQTQE